MYTRIVHICDHSYTSTNSLLSCILYAKMHICFIRDVFQFFRQWVIINTIKLVYTKMCTLIKHHRILIFFNLYYLTEG